MVKNMDNNDNYTEDIEIKNRFRVLDKLKITNESIKSANISECSLCDLVDDFKIFKQNLINKASNIDYNQPIAVIRLNAQKNLLVEVLKTHDNAKGSAQYKINAYIIDKRDKKITQKISVTEADKILRYESNIVTRLKKPDLNIEKEKLYYELNEYIKEHFHNPESNRGPPEEFEGYPFDDDFDIDDIEER